MSDKIICKICGKEYTLTGLGKHLKNSHKISSKTYYDLYFKKDNQGKCENPSCNNETKFLDFRRGYQKNCCLKCSKENPEFVRKVKNSCHEKYGVDNPMKVEEIKDKLINSLNNTIKTNKDKIVEKRKNTLLKRYGTTGTLNIKEFLDKARKTTKEKYGEESYARTDEYKKQIEKISLEKYGVKHHLSSKEILNKKKETSIRKRGVEHSTQDPKVKEKIKQSNLIKYGVEYTSQVESVKKLIRERLNERWKKSKDKILKKRRETNLNRYGEAHYLKTINGKKKQREKQLESFRLIVQESLKLLDLEIMNINNLNYTNDLIDLKCIKCKKEYKNRWYNIQLGYGKCPKCFPRNNKNSKNEKEIFEFIESLGLDVEKQDRDLLKPKELDIIIPSKKVAIEHDGLYWHDINNKKDKNYHINKTDECIKKGYRLIHIFEDEWLFKKDIIKSMLKNILNINNSERIHARKCIIKEISTFDKGEFLEKFHIMGRDYSLIKLGAFYNNELISVMTFSHGSISRYKSSSDLSWELSRFCSNYNYRIPGIASKLLTYFKRNYKWEEIFSYADLRYSNGNMYKELGFEFLYNTLPDYWYVDKTSVKRIHRFKLRKTKDDPKDIPEWLLRSMDGYTRIYDCGKMKFIMKNKGE